MLNSEQNPEECDPWLPQGKLHRDDNSTEAGHIIFKLQLLLFFYCFVASFKKVSIINSTGYS
jgi:hypothetical protein